MSRPDWDIISKLIYYANKGLFDGEISDLLKFWDDSNFSVSGSTAGVLTNILLSKVPYYEAQAQRE